MDQYYTPWVFRSLFTYEGVATVITMLVLTDIVFLYFINTGPFDACGGLLVWCLCWPFIAVVRMCFVREWTTHDGMLAFVILLLGFMLNLEMLPRTLDNGQSCEAWYRNHYADLLMLFKVSLWFWTVVSTGVAIYKPFGIIWVMHR